jgi:hypothetical protein
MADGDPIIIGQANTASNPGNETSLSRNEVTNQTVFVARNLNVGDGIRGEAPNGFGVSGISTRGAGIDAFSSSGFGVRALSISNVGVIGHSRSNVGVSGTSTSGVGVRGGSGTSTGAAGSSTSGRGVSGISDTFQGVYGECRQPNVFLDRVGGFFMGSVTVVGAKNFKIDHPLDPENKYLLHTCVESSEMKNVYDGVARLDADGAAWVDLPAWFEALNGDFRYQLTAVGAPAPNLHIAEEVSENRFKIVGGEEGMKVCWQVTGSRKDPSAAAQPFAVEQEKREEERGRYLEPSLYDAPEEQRVMIGPIAEAVEEQPPPEPSGIDFARLEEERLRQLDEWRRLVEEQRREMEEEMEELRRRMDRQEEAPPEST